MSEFTIATPKGRLTTAQALYSDLDILPDLSSLHHTNKLKQDINGRRSELEDLLVRHLRIPRSGFVLSEPSEWIHGTFNICLPVRINEIYRARLPRRILIRIPLPFNVGEGFTPSIVDEKLRCEAATYIWLNSNCPEVPIPRLLGMGFPGRQSFTAIENESLWAWMCWQQRRFVAWLHGERLPPFFSHHRNVLPDLGYLLIEFVEEGKMLSSTWPFQRHHEEKRTNLYRGLSRIMLALAKVPLPRIGSWTLNDRGILSLTNRPLSDLAVFWSRYSIPTDIARDTTYLSADSFVSDTISYQDQRMRFQPNAVLDQGDGVYQLSALIGLRALLPKFWSRPLCSGPFILTLTDMHQSNIFVDEDWNVTCLIDLEFAPVYPIQMAHVPHWLSSKGVDELVDSNLEEYKICHDKFIDILEQEELVIQEDGYRLATTYSKILREQWDSSRFWYSMALSSVNAFPAIYDQHLRPIFFDEFKLETDGAALAQLWGENVWDFLDKKLKDRERYEEQVREIFALAEAEQT